MPAQLEDPPTENPTATAAALEVSPDRPRRQHQTQNFWILALYQILMRTGWIFKTESIIMPAVLDALGGAGWLRGFLPMLNRLAVSVSPLLYARRLAQTRLKKISLLACALGMAAVFCLLAACWYFLVDSHAWLLPGIFLACYATFFVFTGLNQLSLGTLQGKLVRPQLRGRLMLAANTIGVVTAVGCAATLMPLWLRPDGGDFHFLFAFSGVAFGFSALICLWLREPPDDDHARVSQPPVPQTTRDDRGVPSAVSAGSATRYAGRQFADAFEVLRSDRNFRKLAFVAAMFGSTLILFPHFQALGRERLGLTMENMVFWVVVQNIGTAVFSMLAGPIADSRGNRLALQAVLLGVACVPGIALGMTYFPVSGAILFPVVFTLLGFTPVTFRLLSNYALEICSREEHPRYLAALGLCLAAPTFVSVPAGYLVDWLGYEAVFCTVIGLTLLGWLVSFTLKEPRHHLPLCEQVEEIE